MSTLLHSVEVTYVYRDFKCEPSAVLITPESNFANPVGVVHDHPYSDYFRRGMYGMHVYHTQ